MDHDDIKCLNCEASLSHNHTFCSNCGQNRKDTKLSVGKVIGDALSNLFNIDNRLFHTLKDIYSPSKLTSTYVAGKRKYYMNPARVFIFSLIALISLILINMEISEVDEVGDKMIKEVALAEQKILWDSLMTKVKTPENKQVLYELEDTLYHGMNIDSLFLGDIGTLNVMGYNIKNYKITKKDAVTLSIDEIAEKYNVTTFGDKLFIKQYIKTMANASEGIKYIVKNLTWVILILIFFMAGIMKLFYWKRNYYYVEHLVLLLYSHSLAFVFFILVMLTSWVVRDEEIIKYGTLGAFLLIPFVQYSGLKKYYKQGWFITLIKMMMINIAYITIGSTILVFGALASFVLF